MATRDFSDTRFEAYEPSTLKAPGIESYISSVGISDEEDDALTRALAARWNACADALALLDTGYPRPVVEAILRRAIYGDEE